MTSPARGMPNVDLQPETIEQIKQEEQEQKPVHSDKMFSKPNLEIKVDPAKTEEIIKEVNKKEVKFVDDAEPVLAPPKPIKKPKKKLTEKQLEALRRGREKSIQVRREKAKQKVIDAGQKASDPAYAPPKQTQSPAVQVQQQVPQIVNQQAHIDYDKIINGVVNRFDNLQTQRSARESRVAHDIDAFEQRVRDEERKRVLDEIDKMQKEDESKKNSLIAHHHLTKPRPAQSINPYLYAMEMGAQSRYKRY